MHFCDNIIKNYIIQLAVKISLLTLLQILLTILTIKQKIV